MLEELYGKIRDLEKVNSQLKEKVCYCKTLASISSSYVRELNIFGLISIIAIFQLSVTKQQLQTTQSSRPTAYGHVQARINTVSVLSTAFSCTTNAY